MLTRSPNLCADQGTFILLILGEAIIQLVQAQHGQSFEDYAKAIMGFGIVFNIGDVYYQQQVSCRDGLLLVAHCVNIVLTLC